MKLHVAVCDQSPCLPYKGLHHLGPHSTLANRASAQERELNVYPLLSELESDNTMQQTIWWYWWWLNWAVIYYLHKTISWYWWILYSYSSTITLDKMHCIGCLSIRYGINKLILHTKRKICRVIFSTACLLGFCSALIFHIVAHPRSGRMELNLNVKLNIRLNN